MKRFFTRHTAINIGIIVLILFLFTLILRLAGNYLVREEPLYKADAAIILMGSITDRVLQASDLYQEGYFEKLILVEENMGPVEALVIRGARLISNTEQCRQAAVDLGIPDSCITVLPGRAASTQKEALIARNYLAGHPEISSLLIITSASHTRRAAMIFRKVLKGDRKIEILTSPSIYSSFRAEKWWRYRESRQDVVYEYIKILNFLLIEQFRISTRALK
ncbi:MAG: YdcF family protein [Bacteroidales bacterium]|nr:YdcF family protein [Bacteroidales bacterium]